MRVTRIRAHTHARESIYARVRADIRYCARVRAQCGAGEPKIHLVFTKNLWISFMFGKLTTAKIKKPKNADAPTENSQLTASENWHFPELKT